MYQESIGATSITITHLVCIEMSDDIKVGGVWES